MHKSCLPNLIEWWLWQTLSTWKAPFLLSLTEPEKHTASSNRNAKERCSWAALPQGCHPPPSRACISLVLPSRPPLRQTPLNTHPSPEQVQSNAGNHLSRHQVWAPPSKFALRLGKGWLLTSAACRGTSNTYTHLKLYRELLPFCFYKALHLAVPPPGYFLLPCYKKHKWTCKKSIKKFCLFVLVRGCVGFFLNTWQHFDFYS